MGAPATALPRRGGIRTLVLMMALANGVSSLPSAATVLALPQIHRDLGVSVAELQWTLTGYLIANAALIVTGGRLADLFGRRRLLVWGGVLFIAAATGAALAPDFWVLVVATTAMGAGSAILTPASLAVITNALDVEARGGAVGAWGSASAVASGIGPVIGGALTAVDWRLVFAVMVPIALVVLGYALAAVTESRDEGADRRVDVPGVVLSALGITALTLVLVQGAVWGWTSAAIGGLAAVAVILVAAFLRRERRAPRPLMDLRLFRRRGYAGANLVVAVLNFAFGAATFVVPLLFQTAQGRDALESGLLMLPLTGLMALALPVGGIMAPRTGVRLPMVAGLALMAAGSALMAVPAARDSDPLLLVGLAVLGAGTGLALTPLNLAAFNAVGPERHGEASGVLTMLAGLGSALGVAATSAVLTAEGAETPGDAAAFDTGFGTAMVIATVVSLAGIVLAMLVLRRGVQPALAAEPVPEEA